MDSSTSVSQRAKYYRWALYSSAVSKVATVAAGLTIAPVVATSLGADGFALYSVLLGVVAWLGIASVGLGPPVTTRVAQYTAQSDETAIARTLSQAYSIVLTALTPITIAFLTVVSFDQGLKALIGPSFAERPEVREGLIFLSVANAISIICTIAEAVIIGRNRQYLTNLATALGTILSIAATLSVANTAPTMIGLLVASQVPLLLVRILLICSERRSGRLPRASYAVWSRCGLRQLTGQGAAYALAGTMVNFVSNVLPVILIGHQVDAGSVGSFAAVLNLVVLISGATGTLITALWPSFSVSLAIGDRAWARKAYYKAVGVSMTVAVSCAIVLSVSGTHIFHAWFRGSIEVDIDLLLAAALYLVCCVWEATHYATLVGVQALEKGSLLVVARSVVTLAILLIAPLQAGPAFVFVLMSIAILAVDAFPLFLLVQRRLRG